ncbi:MAG: glycosyltransferase family 39 protein [Pirellulaceae bacterium]|nr:glycosyltransferase family 39 protein [Pirellulaceae bacterium]
MRQFWFHQAIIVLVALVVLFTNLGGTRLWDRDEPRNAGCAAEMLERGDWVVPVFNAELRGHKPVLLYWLMMSAYAVFGVDEFAARFWSAVLAVGTALATYQIGRKLFDPMVGLWAAVILTTSLMFDVAGRAATPDSVLIFFSTLALMIYVLAGFDARQGYFPRSWAAVAALYGTMGLAVLAKGPVGLVLPTAVIGMFLLIMRLPQLQLIPAAAPWWKRPIGLLRPFAPRHFLATCWFMRPITAVLAAGAVALPWYIWVGMRTDGEFLRAFFLEHNLGRAQTAMEGHGGSILFYPAAILIGFFPWSVFMGPTWIEAIVRMKRRSASFPGIVFAMCWIGVYVGLFSLAQTKLPSYVTPCYPALALLTGLFLHRWTTGDSVVSPVWIRLSYATLGVVGLGIAVALPVASHFFLPGEGWLGVIGAIPLLGAVGGLWLIYRQRRQAAALAFTATATVFVTTLFGLVLVRVDRHQQNHLLLDAIAQRSLSPTVASYRTLEPTWVFYGGRPIKPLVEAQAVDEFLTSGRDRFLITTRKAWEQDLRETLPAQATILAECPLFLKKGKLVLIACATEDVRTAGLLPPPVEVRHRIEKVERR